MPELNRAVFWMAAAGAVAATATLVVTVMKSSPPGPTPDPAEVAEGPVAPPYGAAAPGSSPAPQAGTAAAPGPGALDVEANAGEPDAEAEPPPTTAPPTPTPMPAPRPVAASAPGPAPAPRGNGAASSTAANVALRYWSAWSSPNEVALPTLQALYADEIDFFGQPRSKRYVMREKTGMARRWPERDYVVDPSSVRTACRPDGYCEVTGRFRYRVWRADGTLDRSGGFEFRFGVRGGRIVSEFGAGVGRS
jgi:hypothetical protein